MGKYRGKKKILEGVEILEAGTDGKCVARVDGQVLFVDRVAPGDVVDVQITKKKPHFMEGNPVRFISYSSDRIDPFCDHFGVCGGCKWQHLPYEKQMAFKQQQVTDQLERIGKIDLPEIQPILGAPDDRYYRNKLEYTFTDYRWLTSEEIEDGDELDRRGLGFHIPGRFDKILNIDHCYLQAEPSNKIRNAVLAYSRKHNLPFYDLKKKTGLLRNLIIRNSVLNEWMVIVQFAEESDQIEGLMLFLKEQFPKITALMYVINPKANETFNDLEVHAYAGQDYIMEEMEGIKFKVGPKSFFQTNAKQAYELYKVVRELAKINPTDLVYDLYTGTGTIANFIARSAKKVVGLEYVEEAIADAKINAELNGIENSTFFAGDMKDLLTEDFFVQHGKPNVIITDPPRAGMHADVVDVILSAGAERIVYVSCNPATQARDLALLDGAYAVRHVQPVDMFPQTHHVENVVLLEKK